MEFDDIIYLLLLTFSMLFGYIYRMIENPLQRKYFGTIIGFFTAFYVSGVHVLHLIICVIINSIIIIHTRKKWCHIISFIYTFSHLLFFRTTEYFGIPFPPAHTNLIQMILTLKIVGLAFECNTIALQEQSTANPQFVIKFSDIFHYSFNYIGLLTGPYYSYKTYHDFIYAPHWKYADCKSATLNKLKVVPLFMILFLIVTYIWPLTYVFSDEFYEKRSWLYRFWYTTPTFFWFRMRIYIGLTLSECVCTAAGFGAYPVEAESKPGLGPSVDLMSKKMAEPQLLKYDFKTIHNIDPYNSDFCVTFREGMKHWNMCVQYWLAVNVYKRFPLKTVRTLVTMFVSAVWHGVYIGHYFTLCLAPFYLIVEDLYFKTFRKNAIGLQAKFWDWTLWIFKMQAFGYLGIAFQLLTVKNVLKYYGSIYHIGFLLSLLFYIIGSIFKPQIKKTV